MMLFTSGNKTGRRKLQGQSHSPVETPHVLKHLPRSPNPELTSVLSLALFSPSFSASLPVISGVSTKADTTTSAVAARMTRFVHLQHSRLGTSGDEMEDEHYGASWM